MEIPSLPEAQGILLQQKWADTILHKSPDNMGDFSRKKNLGGSERELLRAELEETVKELLERGVSIENFIGKSKRIVFLGKYQGKKVVIKFAAASTTVSENRKEHNIYQKAKNDRLQDQFAQVFLMTGNGRALVQEYCTDFIIVDDWKKPRERWFEYNMNIEASAIRDNMTVNYKNLSGGPLDPVIKYKIYELQMGKNKDGKWVFVDYGT